MGVKSTIFLTRAEAERRLVKAIQREQADGIEKFVKRLTNEEIENLLEVKNDTDYRREFGRDTTGFDNYLLID
jgi:hypothetical protein